jgi:hypothetical protein
MGTDKIRMLIDSNDGPSVGEQAQYRHALGMPDACC